MWETTPTNSQSADLEALGCYSEYCTWGRKGSYSCPLPSFPLPEGLLLGGTHEMKSEITAGGGTGVVTDRARRWFSSSHRSLAGLSCSVLLSPPRASPLTATQGEEHLLEGRVSSLVNWVVPGFGGACAWQGGSSRGRAGGLHAQPLLWQGVSLWSPPRAAG